MHFSNTFKIELATCLKINFLTLYSMIMSFGAFELYYIFEYILANEVIFHNIFKSIQNFIQNFLELFFNVV